MSIWKQLLLITLAMIWLSGVFAASWFYHTQQTSQQTGDNDTIALQPETFSPLVAPENTSSADYRYINDTRIWPTSTKAPPKTKSKANTNNKKAAPRAKPVKKPPKKKPPPKKKKPQKKPLLKAITMVGSQRWAIFIIDKKRKRLRIGDTIHEGQKLTKIGTTWIEYQEMGKTQQLKLFSIEKK